MDKELVELYKERLETYFSNLPADDEGEYYLCNSVMLREAADPFSVSSLWDKWDEYELALRSVIRKLKKDGFKFNCFKECVQLLSKRKATNGKQS